MAEDRSRTYALEAIAALCLVVAPGVAAGAAMDSEHGNIAEWVAAISTSLAFVAAFFAAQYTKRAFEIEQSREDRTLDALEREQASKVAAWAEMGLLATADDHVYRPGDIVFVLRNVSDVPVTGVSVRFYLHRWIGNGPESVFNLGYERLSLLAPRPEPRRFQLGREARDKLNEEWDWKTPHVEHDLRVRLSFVDASGVAWQRHPSGELEKVDLQSALAEASGPASSISESV